MGGDVSPGGLIVFFQQYFEFPRVLTSVHHIAVKGTDLGVRLSGFKS